MRNDEMKPSAVAGLRTKNRLAEHVPHGARALERAVPARCFSGEPAALVVCPCGWTGWLKERELEI